MRKPRIDIEIIKARRSKLSNSFKNGTLILGAHPEFIRNNDVYHSYRQDSNFYYLTGFEESDSILVFRPNKKPETVLFVRPKDLLRETWEGFCFGVEGAKKYFAVDEAYSIDQFKELAPKLLLGSEKVFYPMLMNKDLDTKIQDALTEARKKEGRSGKGLLTVEDPRPIIGEMRLFKSEYEIQTLKKAADISSEAHMSLMKKVKHGLNERSLQGAFIYEILSRGASREGYPAVVASGNNATTLHYVFNDKPCQDGDLLLVDAGAEYNFYTADITRTYPVNGKFTAVQKNIYQKVLEVQKEILSMIRPGLLFQDLQEKTTELLVKVMISEKLLNGSQEEIIKNETYKKYYPHGVSHWLGLDVHDSGLYKIGKTSRSIEEGMCFTVEPGLYINQDAPVESLRGIGVRIEDDVIVTKNGCEILSNLAIKEVDDIERWMNS